MPDVVIAVDVGGTVIKSATVSADMEVIDRDRRPTGAGLGTETVYSNIVESIRTLQARLSGDSAIGIGTAITGIVDDTTGVAVHSENVGWNNIPLRDMIGEEFGLPSGLGHDVRAGTMAEGQLGAARGYSDYAFIAIGTGVSAGIVVNGQLAYGGGYAGEVGHVNAGLDVPCLCGGVGCVEAVASAAAVARRYSALTGVDVDGAKEVADRVRAGDEAATEVWAQAVDALATAFAWTAGVVGSEAIVVGGGMATAGDLLMEPLREQTKVKLNVLRCPTIVQAQLGDEAGCLGAALIAWDAVRKVGH